MDEISNMLFGGDSNTAIDVLSNLLNKEDIELKSDLTMQQVKVLLQIKWFKEISKKENLDKSPMEILQEFIIPYFLALMCSVERKSRKEVIEAIKDMNEKFMQPESILNAMSSK